MTVVDAHHHFWDRSIERFDHTWQESERHRPICRNFLPRDLEPLLNENGIDHTVFVQTQHDTQENQWALNLAEDHSFIAGVVGWVDLTGTDCDRQVQRWRTHPRFVGVRHIVQDEPNDDFILNPSVQRGLSVLQRHEVPFDLLFYDRHLKHAAVVARAFPELLLVIDHLSKPKIRAGEIQPWRSQLEEAASCENVFCKLSGLVTEADWQSWTVEDLRPYAETAIEAFGPQRIMFGSDWPVCTLAADYGQVVQAARDLIGSLSESEQAEIMGGTAVRFYDLKT